MVYETGKNAAIPTAFFSAAAFGVAAFYNKGLRLQQGLQAAAAATAVLVIPYTLTIMAATNGELHQRAAQAEKMGEMEKGDVIEVGMPTTKGIEGMRTENLMKHWGMLNIGRAAIPLAGIVCAITALAI
jgi:Domain of unknown function (DUF1772)